MTEARLSMAAHAGRLLRGALPQPLARLLSRLLARPRALLLAGDGLWDPAHGSTAYRDFGAWCAAHPGQACELWVGAGVLADLVCTEQDADRTLREPAARTAWARRVLHHYYGEAAALWPMLPWQAFGALGASALRGVALDELQAEARRHGVVLCAVRPLWPRLLKRLLAQHGRLRREALAQAWLLEVGGSDAHLTRVGLARGRVSSLQRRRLQAPWAPALQRLLDEEPAVSGMNPTLLWLGPAPEGALPLARAESCLPPYREVLPAGIWRSGQGPDFLRPQARPGLLAWAWLGTCMAVLALAAGEAREAFALRAQVLALAVPAAAPRAAAVPAPVDPALLALRQRLHHPWQAVFLASEEPATAGLRWVSLDHRAGTELRLQGLASDAGPVQRAAATLRQQPAWQQVLVARLEAQQGGQGQAFEIVARLREAAP